MATELDSGTMTRFQASESIERPAEEVFDFLADPRNEPAWLSQEPDAPLRSELSVELLSGEPGRPGSTHRRTRSRGNRSEEVEYRLAEAEPPRLLRYERLTGKGRGGRTFELEAEGDATRLTLVEEYDPTGPFDRLLSKLVLRPTTGRLACEGELARIKTALEGGSERVEPVDD